ncbi:hypothetical protein EPN96_07480 [bacterium]|nr:MAG: hypothetical protein EPN96_07480 [bacterium]
MSKSRTSLKSISLAVLLAYLFIFLPSSPAMAAWVGTGEALGSPKARLVSFVERDDVQKQITSLGVDPEEALRRVNGMTDAEAKTALEKIGSLPAGGDGVGTLIGACLFIFIVLLITDIIGLTHVFSFVNHGRR